MATTRSNADHGRAEEGQGGSCGTSRWLHAERACARTEKRRMGECHEKALLEGLAAHVHLRWRSSSNHQSTKAAPMTPEWETYHDIPGMGPRSYSSVWA